jgi:rhodanese-related sulfurtransferase
MKPINTALLGALAALSLSLFANQARAEEPPCPFFENRAGLCGYYASEISPARAYLDTVEKRGKWGRHRPRPVILDVRSIAEYKAGHPEHAYNVPYPYIQQECDDKGRTVDGACFKSLSQIPQDPEEFVAYVERIIPDKRTPIYTLCRTGVRSVGAGNLLTDAGYTNVRNIWEGFVGINLTAPKVTGYDAQGVAIIKTLPVDLNHDGMLTDEDKNGWIYHQGLPYETRLFRHLIYRPMIDMYREED